jgi:hypothetical protein
VGNSCLLCSNTIQACERTIRNSHSNIHSSGKISFDSHT